MDTEFKRGRGFDSLIDYSSAIPAIKSKVSTRISDGSIVDETSPTYTSHPTLRRIRTRSWGLTPGFRKLPKSQLSTQPFLYSSETISYPVGSIVSIQELSGVLRTVDKLEGSLYPAIGAGSFPSDLPPAFEALSSVKDQVINEVLGKVKDVKINLGQVYAERQMTINMIASAAERVANAYRAFKARDFPSLPGLVGTGVSRSQKRRYKKYSRGRWRDESANAWLEFQYGVLPLLSDVKGAAEQLSQNVNQFSREKTSRSISTSQSSTVALTGPHRGTCTTTRTITHKVVVHFGVQADTLSNCATLGLTNPAYLAWELLPYSFVVDWFCTIGSAINTLDATVGLRFMGGSVVTLIKETSVTNYAGFRNPDDKGYVNATAIKETVDLSRQPLFAFPMPAPPTFKNPMSKVHLLNALALLNQAFSKK